MKTAEIRSSFQEHFAGRGHRVVPSAPLTPSDDPTILFTVAGMVPFKDALTGRETLPYQRATSCQRCVRAGGKHNDLENVGFTARHHTFFEMLGNFSFGDYFKEEAIVWAWEYIKEVLNLDQERVWITVHPSDTEANEIWTKKVGINESRVVAHEENFWAMGDTGPCGPCSEVFYDQGSEVLGGPPGSKEEDGDRFLEIWNLVFPQFDRTADGSLDPLPSPGVDTGMGLERTASVMQRVFSNYEIDAFASMFTMLTSLLGNNRVAETIRTPSARVIADHFRAAAFLINDRVLPDREGRGYVLRRIIRRALRHGHKLGLKDLYFYRLIEPLLETMGTAYPDLVQNSKRIAQTIKNEEEKFSVTLHRGMELLLNAFKSVEGQTLKGDVAFKLYDTYGFPLDLTIDVAREHGFTIDQTRFNFLMGEQQERARSSGQFAAEEVDHLSVSGEVTFTGYETLVGAATIEQLFRTENGSLVACERLGEGESGRIVLNQTSFYGEAGGQVGDKGEILNSNANFEVDTVSRLQAQFIHHGKVTRGEFSTGSQVTCQVDASHRQDVARNHSATHLLHAALKQVLGDHVDQRGSLVEASRLRFDFAHDKRVADAELMQVENEVNKLILANSAVVTEELDYAEAIEQGAVALFGEKYDDVVRVLSMGNGFSKELCGGTHVSHLGEIGQFKITSESSVAAGIRRIEALTGRGAYAEQVISSGVLNELTQKLGVKQSQLSGRITQLLEERSNLQKERRTHERDTDAATGKDLAYTATAIGNVNLITSVLDNGHAGLMRAFDSLKSRMSDYLIVLGSVEQDRCQLVVGVSNSLVKSLQAKAVISHLSERIDVRGGGKPHLARAGGTATLTELRAALESVPEWVRNLERQ